MVNLYSLENNSFEEEMLILASQRAVQSAITVYWRVWGEICEYSR